MAYALIAAGHRADALGVNGGTSGTFDSTGGDLIVLAVAEDTANLIGAGDISDSKGNTGWVSRGTYVEPGSTRVQLFSQTAPVVGSGHTVTITKNASYCSVAIATFSGAHATPFDLVDGGNATGTTVSPATGITPSAANALVVSALATGSNNTITVPTGFTRTDAAAFVNGVNYGVDLAYKIQGSASAEDPEWTHAASNAMATAVASFLEAAGAATPKRLLLLGVGGEAAAASLIVGAPALWRYRRMEAKRLNPPNTPIRIRW